MTRYDDPAGLAQDVASSPRPLLVALDVDGVLAPLVPHADEAVLLEGVGDAVRRLAEHVDVEVAALSGRSLKGLEQFGFDDRLHVIGSHGMEWRSDGPLQLTDAEQRRLQALTRLAEDAAERAGDGAWIEHKPASVVLHVRQADPRSGADALDELAGQAEEVDGARVKAGQAVLELLARDGDKGTALRALADHLGATTVVYAGDDVTDEDAFSVLGDDDVTVKVGDGDTVASRRLRDPEQVRAWLRTLDRLLG